MSTNNTDTPKLTTKQMAFVCAYLQSFNATKAAKQAGYSESNAKDQGCENLAKPYIAAEIHRRLDTEGITPERIKIALGEIAFGDGDTVHRLSGLDKLARVHAMFTEKVEHSGQLDILAVLKQKHGGATDDRLARAARSAGIDNVGSPDGPVGDRGT